MVTAPNWLISIPPNFSQELDLIEIMINQVS
jgi:hypothetical protein